MNPEVKRIIIAGNIGVLFLTSCGKSAFAAGIDDAPPPFVPAKTEVPPTQADFPYLLNMDKLEPAIDTVPTEIAPIAKDCSMPFEGGDIDRGLQYLYPIMEGNRPLKDPKTGNIHHHLGWDIHADFGTPVANICDGTFIWSGRVPNGDGTLGNVVVIKYTYEENGKMETSYVRYAHMENVITDQIYGNFIAKGTIIGEVGASGGWRIPHLHLDQIYADKWDYLMASDSINGDLPTMSGFYAQPEKWDLGLVKQYFKDIRAWLFTRLSK